MKETTIHSLVVARALLERGEPLCNSEDRYLATAGLVIIQDALEIVFYSLLLELGIDEILNIEKKDFDELIGELKKAGYPPCRSGTLKALNKQRVLAKHYAQIAEPTTVQNYYSASQEAIEKIVLDVTKQSIQNLYIADLLKDGEAKDVLKLAEKEIDGRNYLGALVEIRKAIYIEFESDYSVYDWRDHDHTKKETLGWLFMGGWRAPYWTKNKEWIEKNVHKPTDYVQIDSENWRLLALELGIHTAELENLRRLTPAVFRVKNKEPWFLSYDAGFPENNATEANAKYCLDRAVSIILKKQEHQSATRRPNTSRPFDTPPIYIGCSVFERPALDSKLIHTVAEGYEYRVNSELTGFDPSQRFIEIFGSLSKESRVENPEADPGFIRGYLQLLPEEDAD